MPGVAFGAAFVAVILPVGGWQEHAAAALVIAQFAFSLLIEPMYQSIQNNGFGGIADSYQRQDRARTIPSEATQRPAADLRSEIERGPSLFALQRPWWSIIGGGDGHAGSMALNDVSRADQKRLITQLREAIKNGGYEEVRLDGKPPSWLKRTLARHYDLEQSLTGEEHAGTAKVDGYSPRCYHLARGWRFQRARAQSQILAGCDDHAEGPNGCRPRQTRHRRRTNRHGLARHAGRLGLSRPIPALVQPVRDPRSDHSGLRWLTHRTSTTISLTYSGR